MSGLLGAYPSASESIRSGFRDDIARTARKLKKENMTIQELIDWCKTNEVDLNTHIALRAKDDYLLMGRRVYLDRAYFGNCENGRELEDKLAPRTEDGDIDYDNVPDVLILDTGRG